jgi:heptose II phosphotransferase
MADGIALRRDGGYVVHWKEDGSDYWRLVKACIDENIDQDALIRGYPAKPSIPVERNGISVVLKTLAYGNPKRMVFRLEWEGRTFILKRARMGTLGLRRFLPWTTGITYFTRVMRKAVAAVAEGCWSTQGYFCVAERWLSLFRQEVWVLLEYVEGTQLNLVNFAPNRRALADAAENLLQHRMTLDDLALGNFLVDNCGVVRAIDISCRPFTALQMAKMRLKLNTVYGLDMPIAEPREKLCARFLKARYWLRSALGLKGMES